MEKKEEIENEGVATTTPLQELCRVYRYEFNRAINNALARRLHVTVDDNGEFHCNCVDFRALLEGEFEIGRYKETEICKECNKPQPLHFFSYEGGQLSSTCRVCKRKRDGQFDERFGKRFFAGDVGDEESKNHDCRIFKSINEFTGKTFFCKKISTLSHETVDFFSFPIEEVSFDEITKNALLIFRQNGVKKSHLLHITKIHQIFYEGFSLIYDTKRNVLTKEMILD